MRLIRSALATVLLGACDQVAPATPPAIEIPIPPASPPVKASEAPAPGPCEKLAALSLPHVTITSARASPAAVASGSLPALPASCRVQGTSRPTADSDIRFEVAIPVGDAWNDRYLQLGNGGFAGTIPEASLLRRMALGFAVAATDDGHQSPGPDGATDASWALGHPEKLIDFGYRALKETTDAARAVVAAFAGRAPKRSYFVGCSDGGREALMEAQRFPDDFDGIVVGAPANYWTNLMLGGARITQALLRTPESYVPASKLRAIEAAALKACGDEDGVIEDPLTCHFDPGVLRCKGPETDRCLTEPQLQTVRAIYTGLKARGTSEVIEPGYEPGSEAEAEDDGTMNWEEWFVGQGPQVTPRGRLGAIPQFGDAFFRNIVFADPSYDMRNLRFDVDVATTNAKAAAILNSDNPDLGAFRKHGGKLIAYHGWGDPALPPRDSIRYFEAVRRKMGETSDFYRLFMFPGMLHCCCGAGPSVFSPLPAIVDWVESGKAPDQLVAKKMSGDGPTAEVVRTRPVCPYPQQARWDGKGDRKKAESFACRARRPGQEGHSLVIDQLTSEGARSH
jgi:feruloyl esterase